MVKKDWIEKISSMREKYEKESVENVNFNKKNDYIFEIPEDIVLDMDKEEEKGIERLKTNFKPIAIKGQLVKGNMDIERIIEQDKILTKILKEIEEEGK